VNILIDIASFIPLLGVIVFVHEFGHFFTAKLFGMRVFIFSFGFGKRLWGFKWGDTDCRISLVPLGGYVKLEGEPEDYLSENVAGAAGETGDPSMMKVPLADGTLVEVQNPNYFTSRPRWQRFVVYMAGPVMNAVLTISVMTVFFMRGFGVDAALFEAPTVGIVDPGSPAEKAGLASGDRVLAVDGKVQPTWEDLHFTLALHPDRDVTLRVERNGQVREVPVHVDVAREEGSEHGQLTGVWPLVRVGEVKKGSPAEAAGVRPDDGILRAGTTAVHRFENFFDAVQAAQGQPIAVTFWRGGQAVQQEITPRDMGEGPKLGVGPKVVIKKFGLGGAVREASIWTWSMTRKTFDVLKRLLTAQLSPKTLMGPVGMAKASGAAARQGYSQWFWLMAAISLQVGIMNLFPMAPLDGGHLAILAGESLVRRDLSLNAKAWIMNAGALMLLALIGLVLYSDITKTAMFQNLFK